MFLNILAALLYIYKLPGITIRLPPTGLRRTGGDLDKPPGKDGWTNSGYDGELVVPQPTSKLRGYSKDSRDSGVNSGLSDYMSRLDPGRLSSRRWRESVTDYRM